MRKMYLFVLALADQLHAYLFNYMARTGLVLGANTLTNLIPTLYESLDVVSRELTGFIPAVARNSNAERAALNETITIPIVPANSAVDITAGLYAPDAGDATVGNTTMTISKSRAVPVRINGEEAKGLANAGTGGTIMAQRFQQAFRTLANEVEADLAALHIYASRAYGTAGTAPFGTAGDLSDIAQMIKMAEDNGAPKSALQLVLGTSATANIRGKQSVLFKVNEAGTADLLRNGIIGRLEDCDLHNSGQVKTFTKGTAASATTDATGYAVGTTTLTLASAGTGTILAGDHLTFAGDTNIYTVVTGDADVSNAGTITIAEPGLRIAMSAATKAITVVGTSTRNMFFDRSAIQLITRAPAMPEGGDMADDVMEITDPVSGIAFQIAVYRQYRQVKYEVALAWGVKAVAPRHIFNLLG
jgi:hypothetical protein